MTCIKKDAEQNTKGTLTLAKKIVYGSGEITPSLMFPMISSFLLFFLTDIAGVAPVAAASIILAGRVWNGLLNPTAGFISDRTQSRWGRRRPYVLFSALPQALMFMLIWRVFPSLNPGMKALYYTMVLFMFYTSSAFWGVPYNSLGMELTDDYNERTGLSIARTLLAAPFSILATVVPSLIIAAEKNVSAKIFNLSVINGALALVPPILIFIYTKERYAEFRVKQEIKKEASLASLFKSRPFICSNIIIFSHKCALGIQEGFLIYYVSYWLNRKEQLAIFLPTMGIAWLSTMSVWKTITQKYGKKAANIAACAVWAAGLLIQLTLTETTPLYLVIALQALIGIGYGYAHVVPQAMIADVADYDEYRNGSRREGLIFGFWNMFATLGGAVALLPASLLLAWSGYVPNAVQNPVVRQTIRLFMAFGPTAMLMVCVVATLFYSISRERYYEIRADIDARRAGVGVAAHALASSTKNI